MNRTTLLVLCLTLLTACKGNEKDSDSLSYCSVWCPDFDGDGRGEFSAICRAYCLPIGEYPPEYYCAPTQYVNNCDEVRPPFAE